MPPGAAPSRTPHTRSVPFAVRARAATDGALLVEGVAYPALRLPAEGPVPAAEATLRIDSYRTWMDPETLTRLAHDFLRYGRRADSDHDHQDIGEIVESFVTREPVGDYPEDVWVARVLVTDPETVARVGSEELTGFSIEVLAGMEKVTLDVEGVGKFATGRFVDPVPLFLSLVERPAIHQPFASVEEPEAREVRTREEAPLRVTRLVRCERPHPHEEPMPPDAPSETSTNPEAPSPSTTPPTAPETTTPLARCERALRRAAEHHQGLDASVLDALTTKLQARAELDFTDFGAVWAAIGPGVAAWETMWAATMLYENVVYECRWKWGTAPECFAAVAKAAAAYASVVATIAADLGSTPEGTEARSALEQRAEQRAGKKISAARLEKLKAARGCATEALGHLDAIIGEAEGESTEGEDETRSAPTTPTTPTTNPTPGAPPSPPTPPEGAMVSELRAGFEAQLAELRRELSTLTAGRVEDRASLDRTREELTAAQKRVEELEARRPPPRGREPERGAREGDAEDKQRNWGRGSLFGARAPETDD